MRVNRTVPIERVQGERSRQLNARVVEAISHRLPWLTVPDEPVAGSISAAGGAGRARRFTSATATAHFYPEPSQPSAVTRDSHDGGRCAC